MVAIGRIERAVGLRPAPGPAGLILRTTSIHTFGMSVPIGWIAFDSSGRVLRTGKCPPRRIRLATHASIIVEQAVDLPLPAAGEQATVNRLQRWQER